MRYGSDELVDVLESLNIEYIAYNPGATIRGLLESITNRKSKIKLILCCHEQIAVSMAQGYAKKTGKMMAVCLHSNVGLLNASMAVFNAWCDRVPMLIINGCGPMDASLRRPWIDWIHTSNAQGHAVSDFVKWYDQPLSLEAAHESIYRAYHYAMTYPQAPVLLCIDCAVQEKELKEQRQIPIYPEESLIPRVPPVDFEILKEIGKLLETAEHPVIITGSLGKGKNIRMHLEKVINKFAIQVFDIGERYNLSNRSCFYRSQEHKEILREADIILALEVERLGDYLDEVNTEKCAVYQCFGGPPLVSKWSADYMRFPMGVKQIYGDSLSLFQYLLKCKVSPENAEKFDSRKMQIEADFQVIQEQRAQMVAAMKRNGLCNRITALYEIGRALETEKYCLVNAGSYDDKVVIEQFWNLSECGYHLGTSGGAGLGYGMGASIGAALGCKEDEICVNIQPDGDFLFMPAAVWTMKKYQIPILIIVMNNSGYGNTRKHYFKLSKIRKHLVKQEENGSDINNPLPNYEMLARSLGISYTGKVTSSAQIYEVVKLAVDIVKTRKESFLLEVKLSGGNEDEKE